LFTVRAYSIYNLLSKSVEKNKPRHAFDYERYSWFNPKYFNHKLKRKIMSIIYKLYTSIEESLLETYFIEYNFTTIPSQGLKIINKKRKADGYPELKGDYKGYLPLIVKAKNKSEAVWLGSKIEDYFSELGYIPNEGEIGDVKILRLSGENDIEIATEKANNILLRYGVTKIEIKTWTPKKDFVKIINENYSERKELFDIGLVKQHPNLKSQDLEYTLIITKYSTEV
jgi:hypothetical protein